MGKTSPWRYHSKLTARKDRKISSITVPVLRLSLLLQILYNPFIFFIKATLFLFYLEIFGRLRWMRIVAWTGMLIYGLFYFSSLVAMASLCAPRTGTGQLDYFWAFISPTCLKQDPLSTTIACVNIISDLYLFILPLPAVWGLQLARKKKVGISLIISTGLG